MGVFVDENETFPVVIFYHEERNEDGVLLNTEVSSDEKVDWEKLECWFCQPSVGIFSSILEEATVLNSISQKPVIRTRVLRDMVLRYLMKKWNQQTPNGDMVPINETTISKMDIKVANEIFLKYIINVQLDVLLQAIIKHETDSEAIARRF